MLHLAKSCLSTPGDFVELGCYRGDTSLLLARLLEDQHSLKTLFLYDSFEGLPAKTSADSSVAGDQFRAGELKVTKAEVVKRFKQSGLKPPIIKKGFFEQLNPDDIPLEIAFGFLDGDLYQSIKTSLQLTADRLSPNGLLVIHDYNNPELPGVSKAVEEFLQAKPGKFKLKQQSSLAILQLS